MFKLADFAQIREKYNFEVFEAGVRRVQRGVFLINFCRLGGHN